MKMIKSIKIRLKPNNKQVTRLFQNAGCARFAYNWAIKKNKKKIMNKEINSYRIMNCEKNLHS